MKKVLLTILDGWGMTQDEKVSAIAQANTPFFDEIMQKYPHTTLEASGLAVGLPEGQMGNSEVGHMNLGAGRVVYQNLVKINLAVKNKELLDNEVFKSALEYAQKEHKNIHFIGLVSDGGVHSHINHLEGLLDATKDFGITENVYIHAFTDGRDCDPHSGKGFISQLIDHTKNSVGQLASVVGRYYAMDRDKRWERVKLAYDVMVNGKGNATQDILASIQASYDEGVSDEFLKPYVITDAEGNPTATIQADDVVICFNFRTDRGRQITEVLSQKDFPEQGMHKLPLYYVTMTEYDESFQGVKVMFENSNIPNTLGQVLSENNKKQIRIAETEKYPHVTFFFSGGEEKEFPGEKRLLCPSPKDVATYDLKPEMSANDIKEAILPEIENETADFICLNFANPDMVGHTGVFSAVKKACETVDACNKAIAEKALEKGYTVFVLADHGNADIMINPDGTPHTQHTTALVPFIVMDANETYQLEPGKLGDIAPSILSLMGIEIPKDMDGNIIVKPMVHAS